MARGRVFALVQAAVFVATPALKASARVARDDQSDTPVTKVIKLLERLQVQTEEEGKAEAIQYDKYACFCKDQADSKTYAIEQSEAKIASLSATIDELDAEIAELTTETTNLGTRITEITGLVEEETAARAAAHLTYEKHDVNVGEAIKAGEDAIAALKASKEGMHGSKLDLLQVRASAARLLAVAAALPASHVAPKQLRAVQALVAQDPHASEYQSNDIIAVLQQLVRDFKATKQSLFEAEAEAKHDSDSKVLGLNNEKQFKQKAKLENEQRLSRKTEEKHSAQGAKDAEMAAKDADTAFRTELAADCEAKATLWDQRSTSRQSELTAMADALEALRTGVAPKYAAIQKVAKLQSIAAPAPATAAKAKASAPAVTPAVTPSRAAKPVAVAAHVAARSAHPAAPSVAFLQLRGSDRGVVLVHKALQVLSGAAAKLKSPILSAIAAKASVAEDHFEKVRSLIKDLIDKLEADKAAEADSKGFCDTKMAAAIDSRDTQQQNIELQNAAISQEESKKAALLREIQTLTEEIAALHKAINEATELRQSDKANNERAVADAQEGKTAVEQAITVLQSYYSSLLQKQTKNPAVDRDGQTIGDQAPQLSFSGEYSGKQDASKGILGLLEVIQSDFERTVTSVTAAENTAQSEFETFETNAQDSIAAKEADKDTKQAAVTTAEEAIVSAKDALSNAEALHESALGELEQLKAMCVAGEETYEERVAKREQEIESLKQALAVLEDWKR